MRNLKKVLALVLVFALMLSTSVVASAASFPDVAASYQYSEAIDLLASLNILGGYEDGTFKAENNITRAEFSKMLYVTFNGMDDAKGEMFYGDSTFRDVGKNDWHNGYINWASNNAIVGGYGDGTFLPNNNVAVKEAIKMAVTCVTDKSLTYPMGFIQEAKSQGLLDDVTIASNDAAATRGQVAQIVYNLLYTPCRLCLTANGYNVNTNGETVETYVKTSPIEFVFDLTAVGGTDDDDAVVTLGSTYDNVWTNANTTSEEGKITLIVDGQSNAYEYANDVSDLFGQKLVAYFNSDRELVSVVSISDVIETTLDKLTGDGTSRYPFSMNVGEYNTTADGQNRLYTLDEVYTQNANTGVYSGAVTSDKVDVRDGTSTKSAVRLSALFSQKGFNKSNPVTFIDFDADGTYDTAVVSAVGNARVTSYSAASKRISLLGVGSVNFDNATGYEAFASGDYSSDADPIYASYTLTAGTEGKIYALSATKTVEGVLSSVANDNMSAVIDGTTYNSFGDKTALDGVFEDVKTNIDDTVKLYVDDAGYVVAIIVTDEDATYDLNLAKVISANDDADKWGNNVTATLNVVLPDGTTRTLTLDTKLDEKTSDDTQCAFDGGIADFISDNYDAATATLRDASDSEVYFTYNTEAKDYDIVDQYIHYEIDEDTNEVVRLVLAEDIEAYNPTGSSEDWEVLIFDEDLCYNEDRGFYEGTEDRMSRGIGWPSDDFAGIYYEENDDGDLETAYYTASNVPEFYNKGVYTLILADGDVVALIVHVSASASDSDKVLGIITGWNTVAGEQQINAKNSYRVAVTMWVNGETNTYYTEDFTSANLPDTTWSDSDYSGLITGRFAELQLMNNGKIKVDSGALDVTYVTYESLSWAYATTVRGSYYRTVDVNGWTNAIASGWSYDSNGDMTFSEEAQAGTVNDGGSNSLTICDETTFITISGTPDNYPDDANSLLQEVSTSELAAGGTVERTDASTQIYYVFAYTVFAEGEAEDNDNDGCLKTVYVFDAPIDCN